MIEAKASNQNPQTDVQSKLVPSRPVSAIGGMPACAPVISEPPSFQRTRAPRVKNMSCLFL